MSTPTINVEWIDVALDDVMHHFVKDFTFKDGAKLHRHEVFIDSAKGRVVFKLSTETQEVN